MPSRYDTLTREQLATLVPELLLCGHMIDRSGMAWAIEAFGREGMLAIAIDEWIAASPVYTRRMQRALNYTGDDVVTIFKGLQLDIGAPPQFMDFRYAVHDPQHGEFRLDHCGALLDVEPMGEEYVRGMCHDIEDPTFDATALATNPKARMRPVHRPPRTPADRHPHCRWTVSIDDAHPEPPRGAHFAMTASTRAAGLELGPIDPAEDGLADYSGPLLADLDFAAFSHSALVRMADEVCLQQHLLHLGFMLAVSARDPAQAAEIGRRELIGVAGLTAGRLHRALGLDPTPEGAVTMLALHPVFNPAAYVDADFEGATLRVRCGAAHEDEAWISLCGPGGVEPLQAMVRAVDPHLDVEVTGTGDEWELRVVTRDEPAPEAAEVQVARFSRGATFAFQPRRSLPIVQRAGSSAGSGTSQ
jgi:hypothetical protein